MPKSIAQAKQEEERLGRITPQIVAQEDTLASLLAQADITLSALRDALAGTSPGNKTLKDLYDELSSILAQLDVALSTRASELTLGQIKTNTNNIGTPLQDTKIANTIPQEATTYEPKISINKDNVGLAKEEGNLASILTQLDITLSALRDALRGASTKDFSTLETDVESIYSKLNTQLDITISALRDALKGASNKDFSTLETELDKKVDEATDPNEYTVTLTNADTEYSQTLPTGTKALEFWARESVDIRFAFTSGKVATPTEPYHTLKAGTTYYKENINLTGKTLYLACGEAGKHVEIIAWT